MRTRIRRWSRGMEIRGWVNDDDVGGFRDVEWSFLVQSKLLRKDHAF